MKEKAFLDFSFFKKKLCYKETNFVKQIITAAFRLLPWLLGSVSVGRFGNAYTLQGETFFFPFVWVQISDLPPNHSMTPKTNNFHLLGSLCWSAKWGYLQYLSPWAGFSQVWMCQSVSDTQHQCGSSYPVWRIEVDDQKRKERSFRFALFPTPCSWLFQPYLTSISSIFSACPPAYLETTFPSFHTHTPSLIALGHSALLLCFYDPYSSSLSIHKVSAHKCKSKLHIWLWLFLILFWILTLYSALC